MVYIFRHVLHSPLITLYPVLVVVFFRQKQSSIDAITFFVQNLRCFLQRRCF